MPHEHENMSREMKECIEMCAKCADTCGQTLTYCLNEGGRHSEKAHVIALLDCSRICETAAAFMTISSPSHHEVCRVCANICRQCEADCKRFTGDETMAHCANVCGECAESCEAIAGVAA